MKKKVDKEIKEPIISNFKYISFHKSIPTILPPTHKMKI
jgi:hypothetical protein